MAEHYVTTDEGVRLYCETRGSGAEALVFPNGVMVKDDFAWLAGDRMLVFYDPRHRGRSDATGDARAARGIHDDVDDLEAVRRHFGFEKMALFGHSYVGVMVALYAMARPARVSRVIQMSPAEPYPGKAYPAHLTNADDLLRDTLFRLGTLQSRRASLDSARFCRECWALLRPLYVADPAHADRLNWSRCDELNEAGFMDHWLGSIQPSLQTLELTAAAAAAATMPVLIVHGRRDRSAPYGGARDWAMLLPNARLLTVEGAAHAPWLERPDEVRWRLERFLSGIWPSGAEVVVTLQLNE